MCSWNTFCTTPKYEESDFYTTQWQKSEKIPVLYITYRWIIALSFWIIVVISVTLSPDRKIWFAYLTNWGISAGLVATTMAAFIVSSVYVKQRKYRYDVLLLKPLNKLTYIYWIVYTIAVDESIIISILYWTCVYLNTKDQADFMNVLVHGINSALMAVDLMIIKQPVKLIHVFWSVGFSLVYGIFNVTYYFAGGVDRHGNKYLYAVLNWEQHPIKATLIICVGLVGISIVHCATVLLFTLRRYIRNNIYRKPIIEKEFDAI